MQFKNKIKYMATFIFLLIVLFSCNFNFKSSLNENNIVINKTENEARTEYKYYELFNIDPAKIIVPKNQTLSQSLSILAQDSDGNLIVFDGGRVEDADYLCDLIKENGGVVSAWFITHIHDDHIGALYKILNDKRIDIEIKQIYYDFASFEWYYEKIGNDAGIYYLFENAIKNYNEFLIKNNRVPITMLHKNNNISLYFFGKEMWVSVLNNHFELGSDPINNTSITYLLTIKGINLLLLGDLGYEGGNILFNDNFLANESDYNISYHSLDKNHYTSHPIEVLVLAHHGQNGIDPELYKRLKPKVVIWPTSKDIYENKHGRYNTDDTKNVLNEMSSIEYQIKSFEETAIIR
ncbi:MAG: MBL fold metallo-hydrolase [Lachnospiraceae bacterium]|nr:MBL fold metallo-hydrolase [Lachnospiraceae bacterium]